MADRDKRQYRKLKREVKQLGTKRVRRQLKKDLQENPEETHEAEIDFGNLSSQTMNGIDQDATRRKKS